MSGEIMKSLSKIQATLYKASESINQSANFEEKLKKFEYLEKKAKSSIDGFKNDLRRLEDHVEKLTDQRDRAMKQNEQLMGLLKKSKTVKEDPIDTSRQSRDPDIEELRRMIDDLGKG